YDIGVLAPAILNLVCLKPGQAMYLPAGQLHAYLKGVGIELMANSDNVLRGGLTPKHVDVAELMRVLNFRATRLEILSPEPVSSTEKVYRTTADEFELSVIDTDISRPHVNSRREAVQILLCTSGRASIARREAPGNISVCKGTCLLVNADTRAFQIEGEATFYKAAVPEKS
ncbi:MAG: mannose-6-phosphate isomerase, class I, partial [Desulfobacterales bacterium]|nr:mannose-6-phosphate isomerase, class I [Desulfobacterales bacterium]